MKIKKRIYPLLISLIVIVLSGLVITSASFEVSDGGGGAGIGGGSGPGTSTNYGVVYVWYDRGGWVGDNVTPAQGEYTWSQLNNGGVTDSTLNFFGYKLNDELSGVGYSYPGFYPCNWNADRWEDLQDQMTLACKKSHTTRC